MRKISTIEAFLIMSYIGILDLIGLLILFIGLDDFFIIDALSFPVTQFYFRMKGVSRAGVDLVANLAELIPYVGALPLRAVAVGVVIWADWHPESAVAKVTEKAAQITTVKKPATKTGIAAPKVPGIKTPVGGLQRAAQV